MIPPELTVIRPSDIRINIEPAKQVWGEDTVLSLCLLDLQQKTVVHFDVNYVHYIAERNGSGYGR